MREQTVSLAEAFRFLGISPRTGRVAIQAGQLRAIQLGERLRVPRAELERLVRAGAGLEMPGAELRRVHVVARGEGI